MAYTEHRIGCPYCRWVGKIPYDPIRADQQLYVAADQHINAAHSERARELRQMPTPERKRILMAETL